MIRFPSTPLLIAAAAGALGCSDAGGRSAAAESWRAERDTVGDTVIVRTVAGSVWGDTARLVEKLSIGVADGTEEEMLGDIRAIAVAADGTVYLSDRSGPALRQYSPDGRFVGIVGRKGAGPGEYSRPDGGLGVLKDGRVVIRDPGNGRLAMFTRAGEPAGTWRIGGNLNTSRQLYIDTAGALYTLAIVDRENFGVGLARFAPDGTPGDTTAAPKWDYEEAEVIAQTKDNTSISNVPFTPEPRWTFSPLGYYVGGLSSRYAVDLFRPGAPRLRIERTTPPVPVGAEEGAARQREITENMRTIIPGWVWNGPSVPSTKPPFRELLTSAEGNIWVVLSRPARRVPAATADGTDEWVEDVAFDVYEPDGRYLGVVRAPDGFQTSPEPVIRGDTVWAVVEDADGVQFVKRLQLARGAM